MKKLDYLNEIITTLSRISKNTGISRFRLCLCFLRLFITQHVQLVDFQGLYLYKRSRLGTADFWIGRRADRLQKQLNGNSSADEQSVFDLKNRFNSVFCDFVTRDWLYLPDSSKDAFRSFLARNERFLLKPDDGSQGTGIRLFHTAELDTEAFIEEYAARPFLLEAFISQHPAMAALNPSSVNTVRIITIRKDDRVLFAGAGLRCGGVGVHVDNFSHGGIAYPIDLETGIISGPGQSTELDSPIAWNPDRTRFMPGFQLPHWDTLIKAVTRAALIPKHIGFVGWDIAITPDGIEFVEGNIHPGMTVIQLDGIGAAKKIREFFGSRPAIPPSTPTERP